MHVKFKGENGLRVSPGWNPLECLGCVVLKLATFRYKAFFLAVLEDFF